MKDKRRDAKLVMLEHSKAKIELYSTYLSTYLNILSRVSYIKRIHLYDLMCGEGIYDDGSKGSPVIAMEKIKQHYFSNKNTSPDIEVWFNDKDESEIEKGIYKIERVKRFVSKIFVPSNVQVKYTREDYNNLLPEIFKAISLFKNEKALIFIDPYGYKEIKHEHIKSLLSSGNVELILFLPISHMYRFLNKSLSSDDFPGGEPLRNFVSPLFENLDGLNNASSVLNFVDNLKEAYRQYLQYEKILVDTFTIERNQQNTYALFFFTPNILGFEKMLEAKWKIDEHQGKGFKINSKQTDLFSDVQMTDYPEKLKDYIGSVDYRTNGDIYLFGLKNGFLPKHTNEVLREFQKTNSSFVVLDSDGNKHRRGSFHINYHDYRDKKIVIIKILKD